MQKLDVKGAQKSKLVLRATDAVLFGPPESMCNILVGVVTLTQMKFLGTCTIVHTHTCNLCS